MLKDCFICEENYELGDGTGEQFHFAFRHGMIVPVLHNGRNVTGQFVQVVDQGPSRHTWNMRFGDSIEPAMDESKCVQPGCRAKASRGYYCARHGTP